MNQDKANIIVYYDGVCPKCVKDRRIYEKLAGKLGESVCWLDITGNGDFLRESGIAPQKSIA
jgi:predicted DCC family thiol-disulfide oxidoreductase YuxK